MLGYRSEVIGSLLRPRRLLEARRGVDSGEIPPAQFKALEDRVVDAAIDLQRAAGIDVITDGEQRRTSFTAHLIDSVDGFAGSGGWALTFRDDQGESVTGSRPVVVERLRWKRSLCAEDWVYLRARHAGPAKVTVPGAQQAAAYYDPDISGAAYPTVDSYLADVVDILRREVAELAHLGCEYVQLDSPQYGALLDEELRAGYRRRGSNPDQLLDQCIELDNAIISGHPGVTFGLHICRGNSQSKYYASGDYGPIARVFERTKFDRFLLEYDDARSGGFQPLARVPDDRVVVLGLVTTKRPELEPEAELHRRVQEAAKYVPLERLALSPQCGFASSPLGNLLTPEDQQAKLELVGRVAASVWG